MEKRLALVIGLEVERTADDPGHVVAEIVEANAGGIGVLDRDPGDVLEAVCALESVRDVRQAAQGDRVDQRPVAFEELHGGGAAVASEELEPELGLIEVEENGKRTLTDRIEVRIGDVISRARGKTTRRRGSTSRSSSS